MWLLSLLGCTFSPGTGFATLEEAVIAVVLEPGAARDLGEETILTDHSYAVALESLSLEVESVELVELVGGAGAGGSFDPSDPPPGYTLCHGGHCHHESGSLVSYAEVEAELAGGAASFEPIVTASVEERLSLLGGGETRTVSELDPSPELPRVEVSRARVDATALRATGTATPWPDGGDEVAVVVDLPLTEPLAVDLPFAVDRSAPARLVLTVDLTVDGTLFDGLDLAELAVDGVFTVTSAGEPGAATLIDNLLLQEPEASLEEIR